MKGGSLTENMLKLNADRVDGCVYWLNYVPVYENVGQFYSIGDE